MAFGKRKTAKGFHFLLSLLSRGGFQQKSAEVGKNNSDFIFKSVGDQYIYFDQVFGKVNC